MGYPYQVVTVTTSDAPAPPTTPLPLKLFNPENRGRGHNLYAALKAAYVLTLNPPHLLH